MLNLNAAEFAADVKARMDQNLNAANPSTVAKAIAEEDAAAASMGVSPEMRTLLVNYCATMLTAIGLDEVDWVPLSLRLGTKAEWLESAAAQANSNGRLWMDVLQERIRRVGASTVFRNVNWEKLESSTLNTLMMMAEKNLIRDPGELLAIAGAARRINDGPSPAGGGVNISINAGDGFMRDSGLPAAGATMKIDLSPRLASTLASKAEKSDGARVIDGQMIDAKELRSILEQRTQDKIIDANANEGESNE